MRFNRTIILATISIGAMLAGGIAQAVPAVISLTITEHSSTSLTATLTGTLDTVLVAGNIADQWSLFLSGTVSGPTGANWQEPGEAGKVNSVSFDMNDPHNLSVYSDFPSSYVQLANGATDTTDFKLDGLEMNVTFIDDGDTVRVPDAASTLPLLSLSLVGLGILAKRLKA